MLCSWATRRATERVQWRRHAGIAAYPPPQFATMAASHMHTCTWTPSLTMRAPSQGASRSRVLTGPQRCAPRRSAVRVCASSEPPKARCAHSLACLSWWCCHSDCRSVSPGLTVFACVVSVPHRFHLVATAQGHAEQPGRGAGSARAGTTQPGCSLRGRRGAPLLVGVAWDSFPSTRPHPLSLL